MQCFGRNFAMGVRCTLSCICCFGRCSISDVAELVLQGHLVFTNSIKRATISEKTLP